MGLSRRKFTKEFKEAAVRRLELGAGIAEVARACDVNPNVLHRWRRELRDYGLKAFAGNGQRRQEESRIAELERKVGRQALEIGFFAAVLAACRGRAEAASVDYAELVYPFLEKEMRLATPLPLYRLCRLTHVSRAGYYRWLDDTPAVDPDLDLRDEIQRIALEFPSYGRPRITEELKRRGWEVGGFVENAAERIMLQTQGQALTAGELGEVALAAHNGVTVRIKDVATVKDGPEPKVGDAAIDGKPGVMIMVSAQYGANTLEVTEGLDKALAEMRPMIAAQDIVLHDRIFRPTNFIQTSIRNINRSLLLGAILVSVVLFAFLFKIRTAFISLTVIPLSLLLAVAGLQWLGITLNTLTLGGLAIAIGEVVDDAIIDVENILRRLKENRALGNPKSRFRVVLDASIEVRGAVVYATFVVALVFLPVLTMSGVQGRLFGPLAIAYILAIFASLLVALTLTPALSAALLPQTIERAHDTRFIAMLKKRYQRFMRRVMKRPAPLLATAGILCLAALAAIPFFGGEFLPDLKEGHFIIHMSAVPGTSIRETMRIGNALTRELKKDAFVGAVAQQIGRAELADDTWPVNYEEMHVDLKPLSADEADAAETKIRKTIANFPGVYFAVRRFLGERIEETVSGVTAEVVIKIFGDDLDILDRKAKEVSQVVAGVRGATSVQVESPSGSPRIVARLRPDRLRQFGFRPVDVMEAVGAAYEGTPVAQTYQANRVFDVAVILDERVRQDPEAVGRLMLASQDGLRVPLRQLADIYEDSGRSAILHDATRRRRAVTCDVRGRDLTSFVEDAQQAIANKIRFPSGTYAVVGGASEARASPA